MVVVLFCFVLCYDQMNGSEKWSKEEKNLAKILSKKDESSDDSPKASPTASPTNQHIRISRTQSS